jgi:class 3 adenylate cyclase/tetratricopeptide (TPR) repeat protein
MGRPTPASGTGSLETHPARDTPLPPILGAMVACPTCSTDNPGGSRFCNSCGAPIAAAIRTPVHEERRTVTVLFADLAGFTSRSEALDPEDVRAFLLPYYDVLTSEVTRHGGQVDRFLGDGIMAVFGAPVAHEDDPERAVRASLRILERLAALGLELHARIGINTGPVLVATAGEDRDQSVTGDTVNTAARLQALAPVDGVVVGEWTFRATAAVFDYAALEPVLVKGKTEPVAAYRATAPRARPGVDLGRGYGHQYVGRETDLVLLRGLFDKSMETSTVQLVTVVGEPGIGKSRIVGELRAHAQSRLPTLIWRQGRCLPYGDGITFWALGEIVKAQAGILETDDPATATAKLDDAIPAGPDHDWLRARLLPLAGVDAGSTAERDERYAAWRTFLETVAEQTPTVLVFEDIHWADDAMLAFLEHLADRATGVPLLLVATARPELFERHATFAASLPNVNRVNLAPLTEAETAKLVSGLLGAIVPVELLALIQERTEGNPLYAEEFVRLLRDRDLLAETDGAVTLRAGAELPVPESIGALIAARLDTLPPDRRAMLSDAAVVGKVFWAGAVAAMGGRDVADVTAAMGELARNEFVRPVRHSSMAGEFEYAFWHVLTRDVAYATLPRASRGARHAAAAAWLEAKADERVEGVAEVLAHHYATAVELAKAAGQPGRAADFEPSAVRYLALAGEKALGLDVAAAIGTFERALALTPPGHMGRARLLDLLGNAKRTDGQVAAAVELLQEAVAAYVAMGDRAAADRVTVALDGALHQVGDPRAGAQLDELIRRLESQGPSELLAAAYCSKQFFDDRRPWADRALAIADQLDLPDIRRDALDMRGNARSGQGDPGGIDDLRASLALALDQLQTRAAQTAYVNLAYALCAQRPADALEVVDAAIAFDRSRGVSRSRTGAMGQWALLVLGRWSEVLDAGEALIADAAPLGDRWTIRYAAAPMSIVLGRRGLVTRAQEVARTSIDDSPDARSLFAGAMITAHRSLGRTAEAERAAEAHVAEWLKDAGPLGRDDDNGDVARQLAALGRVDLLRSLLTMPVGQTNAALSMGVTWSAIEAEASGRQVEALESHRAAAAGWNAFGDPYEEAHALLGQGRCLVALGRPAEGAAPLHGAREIFERLGAAPALAETDELRAASQ